MAGRKRKQPAPPKPKKMQNRQALDSDNVDPVVSSRKRRRGPKLHQQEDEFLSSKMSWKILREALNQQKEIVWEAEDDQKPEFSSVVPSIAFDFDSADDENDRSSESETESDGGEIEIDPEEERILEVFMKKDAGRQLTLGDIIARKIRKKSAEERSKVDQSFIDLYKGVGKLLSRYTVGKLPKALMHIPSMELWEDALQYTEPEKWSPCAMYEVTRIFASNFGSAKARSFYKLVLLPRVRDEIRKNKRLQKNLKHLYLALKKSIFKQAAFFNGILFPLCQRCTKDIGGYGILRDNKLFHKGPSGQAVYTALPSTECCCCTFYEIPGRFKGHASDMAPNASLPRAKLQRCTDKRGQR